jgi:GT2 family glycosyltransferase
MPRLSIVFLNFNRLVETRYSVDFLRRLLASRQDCEVIAVDNGSEDGTAEYLAAQADFLTPLLLPDNQGIAGYNLGFEQAKGDIILVLDDDSHPLDNACLDRLISLFDERPELGLIACRIEDKQGQRAESWHLPEQDQAGISRAFVGCGFAIRRSVFAAMGWYPAEFFLYQNEMDVAIQTRLQGYTLYYEPACRVVHRSEGMPRPGWRRVFYATRNTLWLIRRYYPYPQALYLIVSRLLIGLVRAVQFRQFAAYWQGLREGLNTPQTQQYLPAKLQAEFKPFWRQNSIWHQLLGWR